MRHVDIIAEIGINHNGDLQTALKMMDVAAEAGCDYVKFQKRDPELCVPDKQKNVMRDTPWGRMKYIDYKKRIEFEAPDYDIIAGHAKKLRIGWFLSVWDKPSLKFAAKYKPEIIKIPSAKNEFYELIALACEAAPHVIVSTGMADSVAVDNVCAVLGEFAREYTLMHSVSCYPLEDKDAELSVMCGACDSDNIGYSDHTKGIHMAVAAVGMGVTMIEKHITLDRTMWGTDQAASLEPDGLKKMVRNIRSVCDGWGSGMLMVRPCEEEAYRRLKG